MIESRLLMSATTRRHFLAAATAASYSRILGANDRVQVGFVGYGLIGAQHVFDFKNQKDVDMAAMCGRLSASPGTRSGSLRRQCQAV